MIATMLSPHSLVPGHALQWVTLTTALLVGCTAKQPTEIVAGVSTQIRVPEDLQTVAVVVQVGGEVRFCETYEVAAGQVVLPATLGVLGSAGLADRGEVTVQVVGLRRGPEDSEFGRNCVFTRPESMPVDVSVIRARRLTFVDDVIKYLPMPLKESCSDVLCPEDDDGNPQTCVGGKCVSADIDVTSLLDYDDGLVFGDTNTCFDGNNCLPEGATVPVLLEDRDTCTFRALWPENAPRPDPGDLNVRLFYRSLGSEILDIDFTSVALDQQEGFSFEDDEEPLRFHLAENLCESNYQEGKVLSIEASALCPAKRALQPICSDYVPPDPREDLTDGSDPDGGSGGSGNGNGNGNGGTGVGTCTLASLQPVESAIYVLMDSSLSMQKFYGDGGLQFAIGLPLSSPVAARTKVGFGLLPADGAQCGTLDYASPQVPFGDVEEARLGITEILSNEDNVLADDPQFFLEAALIGAYQGLAGVQTEEDDRFNRRAVVVVSNRDIAADPCPGQTAIELANAQQALGDDRIFTYAVALDDGDPGALASATALATAGGTSVFNGVTDETEGARAVNDILTELGTCLYKVGTRLDAAGLDAELPESSNMSYIDPLTNTGVDIPRNTDCTEDADESVSGWAMEGGLVRLCGQACEDLRQVVGDSGAFSAAMGEVAPAVPLVVTAPCNQFVFPPDD